MEAETILDIQKEDNIFQIFWVQEMKIIVASNTIQKHFWKRTRHHDPRIAMDLLIKYI